MQRHKLNLRNRPIAVRLVNCERHASHISGLPEEQREQVDLPRLNGSVSAARDSFNRVQSMRSELKSEISRMNQLIRVACDETTRAVGMVALNARVKKQSVTAVGLELERAKAPVGKPDAPGNFRVEPHTEEGAVKMRWKRPVRRCVFTIEGRAENETGWKIIETCAATKTTLTGLTSGVKYWLRVCAVNAHGSGPWSNAVSVRVK